MQSVAEHYNHKHHFSSLLWQASPWVFGNEHKMHLKEPTAPFQQSVRKWSSVPEVRYISSCSVPRPWQLTLADEDCYWAPKLSMCQVTQVHHHQADILPATHTATQPPQSSPWRRWRNVFSQGSRKGNRQHRADVAIVKKKKKTSSNVP